MRQYQQCARLLSELSQKKQSLKSLLYSKQSQIVNFKKTYSILSGFTKRSRIVHAIANFFFESIQDLPIKDKYSNERGKRLVDESHMGLIGSRGTFTVEGSLFGECYACRPLVQEKHTILSVIALLCVSLDVLYKFPSFTKMNLNFNSKRSGCWKWWSTKCWSPKSSPRWVESSSSRWRQWNRNWWSNLKR